MKFATALVFLFFSGLIFSQEETKLNFPIQGEYRLYDVEDQAKFNFDKLKIEGNILYLYRHNILQETYIIYEKENDFLILIDNYDVDSEKNDKRKIWVKLLESSSDFIKIEFGKPINLQTIVLSKN